MKDHLPSKVELKASYPIDKIRYQKRLWCWPPRLLSLVLIEAELVNWPDDRDRICSVLVASNISVRITSMALPVFAGAPTSLNNYLSLLVYVGYTWNGTLPISDLIADSAKFIMGQNMISTSSS